MSVFMYLFHIYQLKHKIAILRAGAGKSAVSEISLVVHARVANPEGKSLLHPLNQLHANMSRAMQKIYKQILYL